MLAIATEELCALTVDGWARDVTPADWIAPRLRPFGLDTGSVVPSGYDAYARVFHPAGPNGSERWRDIAARHDRVVHPEMQLHAISRSAGDPPPQRSDLGAGFNTEPPQHVRAALAEILAVRTATPWQCWFCVWDGYGGLDDHGVRARVRHPQRNYLLSQGPVAEAASDPANLWWPEDRAWIVVSEIDYAWTYVGGTTETVSAVLADPRLEALPVDLDDKPFWDADGINR